MAKKRRDDIHETPDVSHIQNPDVLHEESDVNVRAILQFVVGLFILTAVTMVLMWALMNFLEKRQAAAEARNPPGPMALKETERLPPEPRLQAAPGFEVEKMNGEKVSLSLKEPEAEMRVLNAEWSEALAKGQKDQNGAVISIPIRDAIKQLVEKGLPARPQTNGGQQNWAAGGMDIPSYQSSGQKMEKRDQ